MANQQGNGRNVAVPDENRPSWRPEDENGARSRRGVDQDRYMRDRDDDRYMQRDRERFGSHWDERSTRWDRDEGYRSTERYGQGQSGYGGGRYEDDRSYSSRNMAYPSGMEERARERGLDERFSQGRGGGGWGEPRDRTWRDERQVGGGGYGHGGYDPRTGYPGQPSVRMSTQQFGDEEWGNEGYTSGSSSYGNQGGYGAPGSWRQQGMQGDWQGQYPQHRREWQGGWQQGRDWQGGQGQGWQQQGGPSWQQGRDWQGSQGREWQRGQGQPWQQGRDWQGPQGGRDWQGPQGGRDWQSGQGQGSWHGMHGSQGSWGPQGGMSSGYGGSGQYGPQGYEGMRGQPYGGQQGSQAGGRGAQGQGGLYGQGGYNEGMYGQGGTQNRFGSQGYQGWGSQSGAQMHRGKGPSGYMRSDERVREMVCEALSDDGSVDATNIEVTVKSGEVVLAGTVEDRVQKRIAEDIVEQVSGVKDVQNQIRVASERKASGKDTATNGAKETASKDMSASKESDSSTATDKRHRA